MKDKYFGFKPGKENVNTKGMTLPEIFEARLYTGASLTIYEEGKPIEVLGGGEEQTITAKIKIQTGIINDAEPRLKHFIAARDSEKAKFNFSGAEELHKAVIKWEAVLREAKRQIEILKDSAPVENPKKIAELEDLLQKTELHLVAPARQKIELLKAELKNLSGKAK